MPSPYSKDLRQKVITAVKPGERNKDVSQRFFFSVALALDLWLKKEKQIGDGAITNYSARV